MMLSSLFSCILMVLLTAGPSESVKIIRAIKGQSATLPCTYSVHKGVTSMCWGRAWCPVIRCSNEIIWTDGHEVTFQHSNRYHLKENLSQGIVSLTIENVTEADTGFYCCRVQISNWLNDQKISMILKVEQASTVTALTTFTSTHPMLTTLTSASTYPMLTTTQDQNSVSSTPVLDIVITRPSETSIRKNWTQPDSPIGVNDTVTGTSEGYQGEHQMAIVHDQVVTTNKGIYIGVGVFVGVLLIVILLVFVLKRYFYNGKNAHVLSLTFLARGRERMERTTTEDINHAVDNGYEIEDNSYIIEKDNIHIIQTCNEKQQPSKFSHNILN
ncbi:hepatitis A virus cellular receptor 1 homolog isoform X1 [Sarcophilus harrisii]|uniref:hepatitis A virus cellular receptor 1 homolog n=1 Tax=Sarcophilus harrisii TaxID=9305 RepID=UPI001301BDA3|nr:hepatitis A virus cellular receptor 1 homolog [Sarcophilus harrisii]XP_031809451.1 hepatitis A virus cellular receptor 1 homolog isoform X1 [Sarcophilus harrisii]